MTEEDTFSFDIVGYIAIAAFWVGAKFLLSHLGVEDFDLSSGVLMWISFMAFWSWRRGETIAQAVWSGTKRYFIYFGSAIIGAALIGAPIYLIGGEPFIAMSLVGALLGYICTLAVVYSRRNA